MAEVKRQHDGPEEGKANATVIAQFESTTEDENGNLIAEGRDSNTPGGGKVIEEFDSAEVDENGNIIVHRKPDFAR